MFAGSSIPRPEYPRPDRQRGLVEGLDWLTLNGAWLFRFDADASGIDQSWFNPEGPEWKEQIIVPFCWESLAAWGEGDSAGNDNYFSSRAYLHPLEVTRENHRIAPRNEIGWYRRRVNIPGNPHWSGKRVILTIGAADFFTDLWCNGIHLGRHEGGYCPIEFDLTDALMLNPSGSGSAGLVVIRVEDPMDHYEQPVGKQWGWYTTVSGIWQSVFVEPRSHSHIDHFRIVPDIDEGRAHFEVFCKGIGDDATLSVEIIPPSAPSRVISLTFDGEIGRGDADIYPVSMWDTFDPKIYRVTFTLHGRSGPVDVVRGYFGMRKISTLVSASNGASPAMLCLNNKPIYLRGALYQSYHADGVFTARDATTLHNDIAFARQAGFDFLRIHLKLDDPILLYHADIQGMLLMQDFPNFGEGGDTPLGRRRFEEMMRSGIRRDFNHPSIIAWCIFNETWGFGGQAEFIKLIRPNADKESIHAVSQRIENSSSFQWVHEMWMLAKSLDETRLIEDMSVVTWEHLAAYGHVDTDINSWHFYIDDYDRAKAHIENVVAKTFRGSTFNYIEGRQQTGVPLINSEYGGVSALDGDRDVSWSFKFLTNELRRHAPLCAYVFTELTDVEWESNGFLNYDRTQKQFGYNPTIVNQGDVLPINAPPVQRLALGGEIDVEVLSSHFSRRRSHEVWLHWLYSGIDTLGAEHCELFSGRSKIPFTHHRVELARLIRVRLPENPMLCTLSVAAVTREGETVASNFMQHYVMGNALPNSEIVGKSLVLRKRVADWDAASWSGSMCSRENAQAEGRSYGEQAGFFEWIFTDAQILRLREARRLRILCEVSSRRRDISQTDSDRVPTNFELLLNSVPVHRALLPNHPHDTRGVLSYLRGGYGAYGYLMRAIIEDELLKIVANAVEREGALRFRCSVPDGSQQRGGLSIYDYDCGRFPIGPTVIVDWGDL